MKRETDTSIFVGTLCEVCKKRVKLSDSSAYWVSYPKTKAYHWECWHLWVEK